MALDFHPDAPQRPELTVAAGEQVADLVRYLNHATRPGAGGLEYPADAYALLGSLSAAIGGLPQLLGQLSRFLTRLHADRLRDDHGGNTDELVWMAHVQFGDANEHALRLMIALHAAQGAIAGLGVKGGGDA